MYAGLDLGSSYLKTVVGKEDGTLDFSSSPLEIGDDGLVTDDALCVLARDLALTGVTVASLTGTGAGRFNKVLRERTDIDVVRPEGDLVSREIALQAQGVRRMLADRGHDTTEFMLVAIGTGTSFTRVCTDSARLFEPGLSVGGRYLSSNAALVGVATSDIERYAKQGKDVDLLMKHIDPAAKFPKSEFVIASFGRLGNGIEATPENVVAGHVKTVATLIAGHLLTIRQVPTWSWEGPIVYIGTPVAKCEPLRDWLHLFSAGIGHKALILEQGSYAGALAAYHEAAGADAIIESVPSKGSVSRFFGGIAHHGKTLSLALRAKRKSE